MQTSKPSGLTASAYDQLLEAIVQGTLAPGEPLNEIHLADRLGMRHPVSTPYSGEVQHGACVTLRS